jgi:hypothetical protein
MKRWRESERDLRAALAAIDLPRERALQIEEYLDHNELGIAWEALISELDARQTTLPSDALAHMRSALERIGGSAFDAEYLAAWERVQQQSQP